MVMRGGENIYARDIEEFLFPHPAVEQARVVGLPDPKYGEELCAWLKLKQGAAATEQEIREFCRGRLAHFKVPRYVRFVTSFPQTVTGKIQKFKIREQMCQELGLAEQATPRSAHRPPRYNPESSTIHSIDHDLPSSRLSTPQKKVS